MKDFIIFFSIFKLSTLFRKNSNIVTQIVPLSSTKKSAVYTNRRMHESIQFDSHSNTHAVFDEEFKADERLHDYGLIFIFKYKLI